MLDEIINYVQSLQNQVEVKKKLPFNFHLVINIVEKLHALGLVNYYTFLICTLSQFFSVHGTSFC